jgi:hypothetical protein
MAEWWIHWRLTPRYSREEASYLILDREPFTDLDEISAGRRRAIEQAINRAIDDKDLPAELHYDRGFSVSSLEPNALIDSEEAFGFRGIYLRRDPLRRWLMSSGWESEFFELTSPSPVSIPDYLDKRHPRYSTELALAVNAWLALKDNRLLQGNTPKQALMAWLQKNAGGLDTSKKALDRIATVSNWKPKGGVPPTPHQPQEKGVKHHVNARMRNIGPS